MTIVSIRADVAARAHAEARAGGDLLGAMTEVARSLQNAPTESGAASPPRAQTSAASPRRFWPLVSLVVVVAAGFVIGQVMKDAKYAHAAAAVTGVSVFAGIYAAAQGIERFLEPVSHWLLPTTGTDKGYEDAVVAADEAITTWQSDPSAETKDEAERKMGAMATAKTKVDERRDDRAAVYWAIASIVGMAASGFFHIYLLRLIGVVTTHGWDVFATGVIVGSGTKPVHDVITRVSGASTSDGSGGSATTTTQ